VSCSITRSGGVRALPPPRTGCSPSTRSSLLSAPALHGSVTGATPVCCPTMVPGLGCPKLSAVPHSGDSLRQKSGEQERTQGREACGQLFPVAAWREGAAVQQAPQPLHHPRFRASNGQSSPPSPLPFSDPQVMGLAANG
jgi:hypothetical protein